MLRTLGQTGRGVRLFLIIALVAMGMGLFTAPVSANKANPKPTAQLEVYVQAHRGDAPSGIPNAMVIISDESGMPVMKGTTKEDGSCLFQLDPGRYIVTATAKGYYSSKASVEVNAGGPTKRLVLTLHPMISPPAYRVLNVLVTADPVKGPIIADAGVKVFDWRGVINQQGRTDDLGYFKPTLLVGTYKLEVGAYGYQPATVAVEVTNDAVTDIVVVLQPEVPRTLSVFVGNVAGTAGIPGADVTILDSTNRVRAQGSTDQMGYYKPLLVPGSYKVIVTAPEYQPASAEVEVTSAEETVLIVTLHPIIYRPLQLYVTNGYRDLPVAGAHVVVLDLNNIVRARGLTDDRGIFKPTLATGIYKVLVTATGYEPASVYAEVTDAFITYRTVDLYPTTHVGGP